MAGKDIERMLVELGSAGGDDSVEKRTFKGSSESFKKNVSHRLRLRLITLWMLQKNTIRAQPLVLQTLVSLLSIPENNHNRFSPSASHSSSSIPISLLFQNFQRSQSLQDLPLDSHQETPLITCLRLDSDQIIEEAVRILLSIYCHEGKVFETIVLMQFRWPQAREQYRQLSGHFQDILSALKQKKQKRISEISSMEDEGQDLNVIHFPHFFSFITNVEVLEDFLFFTNHFVDVLDLCPMPFNSLKERFEYTRNIIFQYANASISFAFEHFFSQQLQLLSNPSPHLA